MAKKIYTTKMNIFNQVRGVPELRDVKLVAGDKLAEIDVPLDCYDCAHHADDLNGLVWPVQSRLTGVAGGRVVLEKNVASTNNGDYFIVEPFEEMRKDKQYLGFVVYKAEKA